MRPNKTIKVVEGNSGNGLLRDLFGYYDSPTSQRAPQIRYRGEKLDYSDQKLRDTIFAFGFILNLTKDQFLKLLLQECSLGNINYKDPYEVLYMYSITKHTNVYETYLRLCKAYEDVLQKQIKTDDSLEQKVKRTAVYKKITKNNLNCVSISVMRILKTNLLISLFLFQKRILFHSMRPFTVV